MAAQQEPVYDRIGGQYRNGRQENPRIAAQIWAAIQDASPVLNVGAGSGEFNAACWRRPQEYLDPEVWRPMSALALIPEADRADGMRRLQADLDSGEWNRRWGDLLALDELDLGYRVIAARP